MMIQEFEKLTGIEPSAEEYAIIEEMYYDFDSDKRAFCADFTEHNRIDDVRRQLIGKLLEDLKRAESEIKARDARITRLQNDLEREEEWTAYEEEHNAKQTRYEQLAESSGTKELTDDEAADIIASEFGFERSRIVIVHEVSKLEINRHRRVRAVGKYERKALFNAWDWNYIRFNVKANGTMAYEFCNGGLQLFWS